MSALPMGSYLTAGQQASFLMFKLAATLKPYFLCGFYPTTAIRKSFGTTR